MDFLILVVIFAVGFFLLRILIAPLQKSQMIKDREREQAEARAKAREEKLEQEKKKKEALSRQKALEEQFFNSNLTRKIIEAISDGTGRLPEEITIYNNHVTGRTNGQMRTFDFSANRVPFFNQVYACMDDYREEFSLLRPQLALGKAINRILNDQYDVYDKAIHRREQVSHPEGNDHIFYHYTSNHVLMRLKVTNQW